VPATFYTWIVSTQYDDLFNAADQNQDGKLDEEELFDMHNFNWMKDADPEGYFTQKAKDHITYMDVNGDGKVDWSEFKYFMKPHVVSGLQV
jgi:Ca2+-binding EF-hand superfamily protein